MFFKFISEHFEGVPFTHLLQSVMPRLIIESRWMIEIVVLRVHTFRKGQIKPFETLKDAALVTKTIDDFIANSNYSRS